MTVVHRQRKWFLCYYYIVSSGGGRVNVITWEAPVNDCDFLLWLLFSSEVSSKASHGTIQREQILRIKSVSAHFTQTPP